MDTVVTSWGRLFYYGIVLGKKVICLSLYIYIYAVQWDGMSGVRLYECWVVLLGWSDFEGQYLDSMCTSHGGTCRRW